MSMDWSVMGRACWMGALASVFVIGLVGLSGKAADAIRKRFGRSYGVLTLAWLVGVFVWLAVVSGALRFGG